MRPFNFSPGPAALPEPVLREVREELLDYAGTGLSVMEMSHRSAEFDEIHAAAVDTFRELFGVPGEFEVLLLQGGATLQFSMVPLNLLGDGERAGYISTGSWSAKAFADAAAMRSAYLAWDGAPTGFSRVPTADELHLEADSRYVHLTSNETIGGVQWPEFPVLGVPLVADMSSDIGSRPVDVTPFDVIYAGAQKNLGPAGVTVAVVRKAALADPQLGAYLRYRVHAAQGSRYNTPPTFAIYVLGKVLQWIRASGGLPAMEKQADQKSSLLYEQIDASEGFYRSPIERSSRSAMNVVFTLPDPGREAAFLEEAARRRLLNVKGHRSVGGVRVSLYNAVPFEAAEAMAALMQEFRAGR